MKEKKLEQMILEEIKKGNIDFRTIFLKILNELVESIKQMNKENKDFYIKLLRELWRKKTNEK